MATCPDLRTILGAASVERDVVRVHGPEAIEYLQGQLSQDVAAVTVGRSARSFLLQPTGKVDAWLRVTRIGADEVLLDVDGGSGAAVLARLQRFRLRTKVELELATWSGWAVRGPGAETLAAPAGVIAAAAAGWPGVEGVDLLAPDPVASPAPEVDLACLDALRIECGVPAMGRELTESTIPAEVGAWCIAASVSFTKGCYTGQELVARIDSRGGQVPRPLRGLRFDEGTPEPPAGAEVHADDDAPAGALTSVATSPVLGVIALAPLPRALEVGHRVTVRWEAQQATATVAGLPLR